MKTIIGIKLDDRLDSAVEFQKILSEFGCSIKTRIGLHDKIDGLCSPKGIILLEVIDDAQAKELLSKVV